MILIKFDGTGYIKNFSGQKFSADKIFSSKPDFRHFCPPKFCPIR